MTRIMTAALLATLMSSTAAFAATPGSHPSPASDMSTASAAQTADAQECSKLGEQWTAAEASHAKNSHLGEAKAKAAKAHELCTSTDETNVQKGLRDYRMALTLLGVKPI